MKNVVIVDSVRTGLGASLNKAGVIWLTLSSVHWADNKTAISKVYVSLWSKGTGVLGYVSSKIFFIMKALSDLIMLINVA